MEASEFSKDELRGAYDKLHNNRVLLNEAFDRLKKVDDALLHAHIEKNMAEVDKNHTVEEVKEAWAR